jgi:hypothetical protein
MRPAKLFDKCAGRFMIASTMGAPGCWSGKLSFCWTRPQGAIQDHVSLPCLRTKGYESNYTAKAMADVLFANGFKGIPECTGGPYDCLPCCSSPSTINTCLPVCGVNGWLLIPALVS